MDADAVVLVFGVAAAVLVFDVVVVVPALLVEGSVLVGPLVVLAVVEPAVLVPVLLVEGSVLVVPVVVLAVVVLAADVLVATALSVVVLVLVLVEVAAVAVVDSLLLELTPQALSARQTAQMIGASYLCTRRFIFQGNPMILNKRRSMNVGGFSRSLSLYPYSRAGHVQDRGGKKVF